MDDKFLRNSDFFDESRTDDECRELEEWLKSDPQHVAEFVDSLLVHNDLKRLVLADDLSSYETGQSDFQPNAGDSNVSKASSDEPPAVEPKTHPSAQSNWQSSALFGLAACLLIAALVALFPRQTETPPVAGTDSGLNIQLAENDDPGTIAATLGDARRCVWQKPGKERSFGEYLEPGAELALESGVAQLTYETGAVVLAEGPCHLVIQENALELTRGKVAATVPRRASGFAVTTPTSHVIDLGTEIGVEVGEAGDTDVHVFDGEVLSRPLGAKGEPIGEFVRLTANDAISFRRGSDNAKRFAANEVAFVRHLREVSAEDTPRKSPIKGDLLMWYAADHQPLTDEKGGVYAWRDSLTRDSNNVSENALQPIKDWRPKLVADAIGGQPALKFDGVNDCLVTTPNTSGDSQTIVFVASLSAASGNGGQLINYNGPPQIFFNKYGQLRALQIRSCLSGNPASPIFDPYIFIRNRERNDLFVGRMEKAAYDASSQQNLPGIDKPVVGVYVYDYESNRSALLLNGKLIGESTAPLPAEITSRKVIGRHGGQRKYFAGLVAELMIFDEGLDDQRVTTLNKSLAAKYGISLQATE